MPGWDSFFVAEAGAAAALAGLIFVGVSLNLNRIISTGGLPNRALEALLLLLEVLVVSSLLLVPDQGSDLAGWELLLVGLIAWAVMLTLQIRTLRQVDPQWRGQYVRWAFLSEVSTILYFVAGLVTIIAGSDGIYVVVPAILCSFVTALLDAWVLLVEINR